ncbi:FIG002776: hypothetical protein [hydrothermal vent metagenome]|uniref:JmjC domain-containing protein n=1 Tax=hydrothermal vent metagenome TaxID=652676 RepID=A0A3B0W592_9ZZZZ
MRLNKLNLFNNSSINRDEFLANYWHKKPLLIRNGVDLADLSRLPDTAKLKQLSCQHSCQDIQSRIVFKNSDTDYDVEFGPFIEDDWEEMQHHCWNLLVSDIDKWQPQSKEILKYFDFIRNWILDDIMFSCGSIGGTVGPHTDHYDVFLLQVHGQRQWAISHDKIYDPKLISEQALKLMAQFNPGETNILNPGDVLYLPPEVAHYGIATTSDCVTCSIGIRTPSHSELLTAFIDNLAQNLSANNRFVEPQFTNQPKTGEITPQDLQNVAQILTDNITTEDNSLSDWFGSYITEYRSLFYQFNQHQQLAQLDKNRDLIPSPFSKTCYLKQGNNAQLFVNGQSFTSSLSLAELICNTEQVPAKVLENLNKTDDQIIEKLFENGSLIHA